MMKDRFILMAIFFLCVSCARKDDAATMSEVSFSLSVSSGVAPAKESFLWESGDRVSVFDGMGGPKAFSTSENGKTATFKGKAYFSDEYAVLYPFNASSCFADGKITTVLPGIQDAVDGSMKHSNNLLAGMARGGSAVLEQICAVAKITIESSKDAVVSMDIRSLGGEALTGDLELKLDGATVKVVAGGSASTSVKLVPQNAVNGGTFNISLIPGMISSGLKFSFYISGGSVIETCMNGPVELPRGVITDLGYFDLSTLRKIEEEPDDELEDPISAFISAGIDFSKLKSIGHPRLFMTASDFASLRKRVIQQPDPDDIAYGVHGIIMKNADDCVNASEVAKYELKGKRLLTQCRAALSRLFSCAYAYRMTGKDKYLERARAELAAVCAFPDWNAAKHFLDPSEMALGVAVAYDWLYYDLSLAERTKAHAALKAFEMRPFQSYNPGTTSNWNQVCNGGAIAASIAVYEKDKAISASCIDKAIKSNLACVEYLYNPNGNGLEGNGYWGYAMSYQIMIIQALEAAFGSSCGLAECEGLKKTGKWKLFMDGPTGGFNFSDSGKSDLIPSSQLIWLAARFNNPELLVRERYYLMDASKYADDRYLPSIICGLARYSFNSSSISYPSQKIWSADDLSPIVLCRDGWEYDCTDKYFGLKGGGGYNSHSHMDAGEFIYDAFGIRWAWDSSMGGYHEYEEYMTDLFSRNQKSNRWEILCQNCYYHNTLNFTWSDGSVNKWHTTDHVLGKNGKLLSTFDNLSSGTGGKVDISCYFADAAEKVYRTVKILGQNLVIIDEITSKSDHNAPFEWHMLTKAAAKVEDGYVTLIQDGRTVYVYTTVSGPSGEAPVFAVQNMLRPYGWISRDWDSLQDYGEFQLVKFSAAVPSGSKTCVYTTVISPAKPSEDILSPKVELPGLDDVDNAEW